MEIDNIRKVARCVPNLRHPYCLLIISLCLLCLFKTADAASITQPTLNSPGNNVTITSPSQTFSWSHPYNDLYQLKIKSSGGTTKYESGKISSKSRTVDLSSLSLTYGSTYKWYVVVYANGLEDSSDDRYFTYRSDPITPSVTSFTTSATTIKAGERVSFSYSVTDGGGSNLKQAELWRSTDGSRFSPVDGQVNYHGGTSASGTFTDTPAGNGTYWYGMHVVDHHGNVGFENSSQKRVVSVVQITKPSQNSPTDSSTITTGSTTFSWSHPYNDEYELIVKDPASGAILHKSGYITAKSHTVNWGSLSTGQMLTYGKQYKWYVVVRVNGLTDSSADRYFTYRVDPAAPAVTAFASDATAVKPGQTITFSYSVTDSGGSNLKQTELWRSADGVKFAPTGKVNYHSGTSASGTFTDTPVDAGSYWYGMHVVDNYGNVGSESAAQKRQVNVVQVTKPTLNAPTEGSTIATGSTAFSWSHPYNDEYELIVKDPASGAIVHKSGYISAKSHTVNWGSLSTGQMLTYGKQYKWYVVVRVSGLTDSSADRYFTYRTDPAAPVVTAFASNATAVKPGEAITFSYSVTDSGGSNLKQTELWRSTDGVKFAPTGKVNYHSGTSASGTFTDTPVSAGSYWYGMHVVDNHGNVGFESPAQKRQVNAVQVTKPTLNAPTEGSTITTGSSTFSWSHPYDDQYELIIKDPVSGAIVHQSGYLYAKSHTVNWASLSTGATLVTGKQYKWYVVVRVNGVTDSSADRYFLYQNREQVRLYISEIAPTVAANERFRLQIIAKDSLGRVAAGYNCRVDIKDSTGTLSRSFVEVRNGTGAEDVSVARPAANNRIYANYRGLAAESNQFQVTGSCSGLIAGRVIDNDNKVVADASVTIKRYGEPEHFALAMSNPDGSFSFGQRTCGTYVLQAQWNNYRSQPQRVDNSTNAVKKALQIDYPAATGTNIPVLLVPGYLGSTLEGQTSRYAHLPKHLGDLNETLKIHDPFGYLGWDNIQRALISRNYHGLRAPYDWRMSLDPATAANAIDKYLIPALNEAKTGDPKRDDPGKKVHVIAHSLGGLLVRSYIQSDKYRNDIDKFVMMGTPNSGGAEMYYLVEGGDIPDPAPPILKIRTGSIENLYKKWNRTWRDAEECYGENCYPTASADSVSFLRQQLPSAFQAMPAPGEKFLSDPRSGRKEPVYFVNDFMQRLNSTKDLLRQRVTVGLCYGDAGSNNTTVGIELEKQEICSTVYPDGVPKGHYEEDPRGSVKGRGDGTVSVASATSLGFGRNFSVSAGHVKLPEACTDFVISFITGGAARAKTASSSTEGTPTVVGQNLMIDISSGVTPLLTDPAGKRVGIDPSTGEPVDAFPSAQFEYDQNGGGFIVREPLPGEYRLDLKGNVPRDVVIGIDYINGESDTRGEKRTFFSHNDVTSVVFTLQPSTAVPLAIAAPVPPPTGVSLHLTPENRNKLSWNAVAAGGVVGYNIYRVSAGDPYLQFVGTTSATEFTDSTATPAAGSLYAISAVNSAGVRSFLTDYIDSNDRDGDGLSNQQEMEAATDPDNSDSDGDGFSDYVEVSRSSNALDGKSTPTAWLSVTLSGTGGGAVNSTPSGIACTFPASSAQSCGYDFPMNTQVSLFATPEPVSILQGWGGDCNSAGNACRTTVDSAKAVSATFTAAAKAQVGPRQFASLQAAYNEATDDAVIKLLRGSHIGHFTAYKGIKVTIEGGYDSDFGSVSLSSAISGNFRIRGGTVRVEGISTGLQLSSHLTGDLNQDRTVDIFDVSILTSHYGETDCGNVADLNGDCIVDGGDTSILASNYGKNIY